MRPSASNFGANRRPSSTCSVVVWGAKIDVADTALLGAAGALAPAHQCDEPHLLAGIVAEQAGELARHRLGTRLFDAAQRHAGVLGLEHDRDSARLEHLV